MLHVSQRLAVALALSIVVGCAVQPPVPPEPTPLRVKVFPGAQNLAHYVGLSKGMFAQHGLKVDLQFTTNSDELRNGLADGAFEIAHAAVDNAVAMVEMAGKDVVIVVGGDSGMNEFFVQPDIGSVADLRGRTVVVDAPNTAYALVAKKILLINGLNPGDYTVKPVGGTFLRLKAMNESKSNAASILNAPFSITATKQGMKSLGRAVDMIGPYQAGGAFVMRSWAQANGATLERYLAAYVEATRWALQPGNRAECVTLLAERLKLPPDVADQTYQMLIDPKSGLAPDAKFNVEGFRNVLALRAEIEGQWGGKAPAPDRYLDLTFYDRALKHVGQ
jgi:ABC-type nitrate/sulfonate/bicarbonate transport system substrate-binding protein